MPEQETFCSSMSRQLIARLWSVWYILWMETYIVTVHIQMLAQPVESQTAEKAVIADFNHKLATYVSAFRMNHFGVGFARYNLNSFLTEIVCCTGKHMDLGLKCCFHPSSQLAYTVWLHGCDIFWRSE